MTEAEIVSYWKLIVAAAVPASLVVGFIAGMWKSKAEVDKLKAETAKIKLEHSQALLAIETASIGQMVRNAADAWKKAQGTADLTFSEEEMSEWVGPKYAPRLHGALYELMEKSGASKAAPGRWTIS